LSKKCKKLCGGDALKFVSEIRHEEVEE